MAARGALKTYSVTMSSKEAYINMRNRKTQNSSLVVFKFAEGELVKHKEAIPSLKLTAGTVGKVWALYLTEPPGYEVEFPDEDGVNFSMVVFEPELEKVN